jgi:hypothetical protein
MEPALLKEHFLTAEDERIRREDVPERAQVRRGGRKEGREEGGREGGREGSLSMLRRKKGWMEGSLSMLRPSLASRLPAVMRRIKIEGLIQVCRQP